ncbi:MAG: MFS transporter [Minisyncoccia bacterium]|jgi:MFS family permease
MKIKININVKVGRVVRYLVLSDLFLLLGWGLIDPVFSVFIIERIAGATLITVGIAAAVYWILRSALEIPIANYLDRTLGEKDDFVALVGGLFLAGFSALAFSAISKVWELYVVQIIHAVGFALYLPSWSSIFSRHLDHDRVSFDWSLDSTVAGLAAGISGLFAGVVAAEWGFVAVFVAGGTFSLIAAFVLMLAPNLVLPKPTEAGVQMKDKTPAATGM